MPKFGVYALYHASKYLGEFEAESKEEAIDKAFESGSEYVILCHQCASEIELGDCYEFQADESSD